VVGFCEYGNVLSGSIKCRGFLDFQASRPPACNIVGALYHKLWTQSSAPEHGRNHRPKHVALIGIINKPLLLHLVVCLYYLRLHISTVTFAELAGRCTPSFLWFMLIAGPAFTWTAPTSSYSSHKAQQDLLNTQRTSFPQKARRFLPLWRSQHKTPCLQVSSSQSYIPWESPMVKWLESSSTVGFKYRSRDRISRQRCLVGSLQSFVQTPGQCRKLSHDRFLLHSFQSNANLSSRHLSHQQRR
jgi:hypothetical protein